MAALRMAAGMPAQGPPPRTLPAGNREPGPPPLVRCEAPTTSCPASPTARGAGAISQPPPGVAPDSPAYAAAQRLAALPAPARHAWLVQHLAALRAGRITLGQLP